MPSLIAFRFVAVVVVILGSTPGWADGELLQLKGATGASIVRLLANLDDDDLDGLPDGLDDQVNGAADQDDLAVVTIEAADPGAAAVRVESDVAAVPPARTRRCVRPPSRPQTSTTHATVCVWSRATRDVETASTQP